MTHLDSSSILGEFGGEIKHDLNKILLSQDNDFDIDLSSYSPYLTIQQLHTYVSQISGKFTILTLSCQSINSKFDDIFLFLTDLVERSNFKFSIINIQETWLKNGPDGSSPDVSMFKLPGHQTFALGASCSTKGGLICYVEDTIKATIKSEHRTSKIWEGLFLEINNFGKQSLMVGNIYRPPRQNNNNSQT